MMIIEIMVELSDIFSAMFDVHYEDIASRGKIPKKAESSIMNECGLQSIKHSKNVAELILKKEDKYEYA